MTQFIHVGIYIPIGMNAREPLWCLLIDSIVFMYTSFNYSDVFISALGLLLFLLFSYFCLPLTSKGLLDWIAWGMCSQFFPIMVF